jgi:hypothetical protein
LGFPWFGTAGFRSSANAKHFVGWAGGCTGGIDLTDFALVRLTSSINLPSYPAVATATTAAVSSSRNGFIYSYPAETRSGRIPVFSTKNPIEQIRYPTPHQFECDLSIESGSSGSALYLSRSGGPIIAAVTSYGYTNNRCPNGFAAFQSNGYNVQNLIRYLRT